MNKSGAAVGAGTQGAGGIVEGQGNLGKPRLQAAAANGQKAGAVGVDKRKAGTGNQRSAGSAQKLLGEISQPCVQPAQRCQQAYGQHSARNGVTQTGCAYHQQSAAAVVGQAQAVGQYKGEKTGHQRGHGGEAKGVKGFPENHRFHTGKFQTFDGFHQQVAGGQHKSQQHRQPGQQHQQPSLRALDGPGSQYAGLAGAGGKSLMASGPALQGNK